MPVIGLEIILLIRGDCFFTLDCILPVFWRYDLKTIECRKKLAPSPRSLIKSDVHSNAIALLLLVHCLLLVIAAHFIRKFSMFGDCCITDWINFDGKFRRYNVLLCEFIKIGS